jgi:hypothetical protein
MSRLCGLPRSIPVCVLAMMLALCARAAYAGPVTPPASSDAPGSLIEVREDTTKLLDAPPADDHFAWDDPSADEKPAGNTSISSARVQAAEPKAPPIIAAPLPPAVLSGLIGLAGVYMYKRRNRLR